MNGDNFLQRWSRLKRAAAQERGAEALPESAALPTVDLSSLPAIDSITAETAIGLFLQAGVPEELMRTALRKAWTADPAIRDFIGIADNQWDFNAEDAMPGFGPLTPADYAQLLSNALGSLDAKAPKPEAHKLEGPKPEVKVEATAEPPGVVPPGNDTRIAPPVTAEAHLEEQDEEPLLCSVASAEAISPVPERARWRSHGAALPQ